MSEGPEENRASTVAEHGFQFFGHTYHVRTQAHIVLPCSVFMSCLRSCARVILGE